jgi:voltage-gated potassium channel
MIARSRSRLFFVLAGFTLLIVGGAGGYVLLEGWGWRDALFMTVTTLSTVGYGEVYPLSQEGRLFSIILILLGVGGAAYTFGLVTDFVVAGELRGALRRQSIMNKIAHLENHYIVCGYGRVGQQVAKSLDAAHLDLVVIDVNPDYVEELEEQGLLFLIGKATEDDVLLRAGIKRAAGLCCCLPSDADNVFTVLTARTLNPNLYIVSRSNAQESERKLRLAGVNQVINPYLITGHRMAAQVLHPRIAEFLDVMMRQGDLELRIEEIEVFAGSSIVERTLGDIHVRHVTGVNVLAVRRGKDELFTQLTADFCLLEGDILVGLGTVAQLNALAAQAGDRRKGLRISAAA